jgi:hypothetical protein
VTNYVPNAFNLPSSQQLNPAKSKQNLQSSKSHKESDSSVSANSGTEKAYQAVQSTSFMPHNEHLRNKVLAALAKSNKEQAASLSTPPQQTVQASSRKRCWDPYNQNPLYRQGYLSSVPQVSVIFIYL